MNLNYFIKSVTKVVNAVGNFTQKNAPAVLTGAGLASGAACVGLTARGALKAKEAIDTYKESMDYIQKATELCPENYSDEDRKNDEIIVKTQLAVSMAKAIVPPVIAGGVSTACHIKSAVISNNRIAKLSNSLAIAGTIIAAKEAETKAYRGRVAEVVGEEKELDLWYNRRTETVEVETIDEKTGEVKTKKKKVVVADGDEVSFFFDENNKNFVHPEDLDGTDRVQRARQMNKDFVIQVDRLANEIAEKRAGSGKPYLFLNEYRALFGLEPTANGQVLGWIINKNDPINKISSGMFDAHDSSKVAFVNLEEPALLVTPNVDGYILDEL